MSDNPIIIKSLDLLKGALESGLIVIKLKYYSDDEKYIIWKAFEGLSIVVYSTYDPKKTEWDEYLVIEPQCKLVKEIHYRNNFVEYETMSAKDFQISEWELKYLINLLSFEP